MKKILLLLALASVCMLQAETFIKVTNPATLQDGDQIVMGYEAKAHVSAGFSDTKKFIATATATFAEDQLTINEPTTITLKKMAPSGIYI